MRMVMVDTEHIVPTLVHTAFGFRTDLLYIP